MISSEIDAPDPQSIPDQADHPPPSEAEADDDVQDEEEMDD